MLNRRSFLAIAGTTTASVLLAPGNAFAINRSGNRKKIRMGIVGGRFGASFHFHEHPDCMVEAVSDLREDRRQHLMQTYKCTKSYPSLTALLKDKNVEAVFIATPAPDHATHVIQSLKAGKHVLCAVPLALTLEDCRRVLETVKQTGLTYMMAETSYYRQQTISVRKLYRNGDFGTIFRAAGAYHHPGLEALYFDEDKKPTWRHGLPPMLYPTHCTAFLISVTGERLTRVSCMGWGDDSPILKKNVYKNPFWNETALFETDKGHPFKVEVDWRAAVRNAERAEWEGEKMSFYMAHTESDPKDNLIVRYADRVGYDDAGFIHKAPLTEPYKQELWWQTELLPAPLRHNSGHGGSHTFITHEFIDALIHNRKPAVDIYESLAYTVPGIVAHASALKGGERMKIPVFDPGR
ncbi:Gfo/Idh/MocA family oxidoreductase [Niabella pedocola]|uniref:Gfo/Idh/MocA family oxidoreductase n=1 Tax=Niabella pedocola TaxID=1752077 RepID=A0ABS8PNH6_9BACT|nr:Gfo/Idh/MocA family oxidoreductase [Niabella pedocola]MCD2422669.1 Gfo/Idh/MocA family oxidoreductase [Niabella pedocola]